MGKLVQRYVLQSFLELTAEDVKKREQRRESKSYGEIEPRRFAWHEGFRQKLKKCPYCGELPRLAAIWTPDDGYDYKFQCDYLIDGHEKDMGCGDWYNSLARAGLSWNYRVMEVQGGPRRIVRHIPLTQAEEGA